MNKEAACLCRPRTHAETSHPSSHSWKLAGHLVLESRLSRDTNKSHFWVLQVILSYTSIQVFRLELWQHFWTGCCSVSVSGKGVCVCVCVLFRSVCQVLRAIVHSALLSLAWYWIVCGRVCLSMCMVRCVPVCLTLHQWRCARGTDYRKALGFARGSFWFL